MSGMIDFPVRSSESLSEALQRASSGLGKLFIGGGDGEGPSGGNYRMSFFERLLAVENPQQLLSPESAQVFPQEDFIAFALHHGVETDAAITLFKHPEYASLITDGLLVRLWHWLKGFRRNGEPVEVDLIVPLSELHAPNVLGSETIYTLGTAIEKEGSLSVSVSGLGAGGSVTRTIKTQFEVPVAPSDCLGLVCDGKGVVTQWVRGSDAIYLISVLDLSGFAYPVPLPNYPGYSEAEHFCLTANSYPLFQARIKTLGLKLGKHYHTAKPFTKYTTEITIEESQKYTATWNLSGPFGESIGFEVSSRFDRSATGSFLLPARHSYIAALKDIDALPMTWSAQPF